MLIKRFISALIIFVLGLFLIFSGGWIYTIGIVFIIGGAVWEFINIFKNGGYNPSPYFLLPGTAGILISTFLDNPLISSLLYTLTIFFIFIFQVINFSRKKNTAAFDTVIELTALIFIVFLGTFLIKIRMLPDGLFWVLISILPAGLGDVGAYCIGSLFGKRKLCPVLSPNKTIEGYVGGVTAAILTSYVIGLIANHYTPSITTVNAVVVGSVTGFFAPLGDLSKSIFKRQFQIKNTGNLIPGHGGILDRIDTLLWAGPIAYFLILFIIL